MAGASEYIPLTETQTPATQDQLRTAIATAYEQATPVYPLGGQTALNFGLSTKTPGLGLSLTSLNKVVDYPARDLTITVEAGFTMQKLAEALAVERQRLPIDVPYPEQATIGGVIATNWSGPRRFGCGTIRDYVIGISAVDGRGMAFKGGGRVVKNVAGYDFCKLLSGSLGTLGVISQVTLRVKPIPEAMACVIGGASAVTAAELLNALNTSPVLPTASEWLSGPAWNADPDLGEIVQKSGGAVAVLFEGTPVEVKWLKAELQRQWQAAGVTDIRTVESSAAEQLMQRLTAFPAAAQAPLVLKASVLPSRIFDFVAAAVTIDAACSFQVHAGNGIVLAQFANFDAGAVGKQLTGKLHPAAIQAGGQATVVSWNAGGELTKQATFGSPDAAGAWMAAVKKQFDPRGILNPGRFVV